MEWSTRYPIISRPIYEELKRLLINKRCIGLVSPCSFLITSTCKSCLIPTKYWYLNLCLNLRFLYSPQDAAVRLPASLPQTNAHRFGGLQGRCILQTWWMASSLIPAQIMLNICRFKYKGLEYKLRQILNNKNFTGGVAEKYYI